MSRFIRTTMLMAAGPAVWALHFLIIYAFAALACARGFAHATPWVIGGTTAVAVTALIAIIVRALARARQGPLSGEPQRFPYWSACGFAALALLAIAWETLPVLLLQPCG